MVWQTRGRMTSWASQTKTVGDAQDIHDDGCMRRKPSRVRDGAGVSYLRAWVAFFAGKDGWENRGWPIHASKMASGSHGPGAATKHLAPCIRTRCLDSAGEAE